MSTEHDVTAQTTGLLPAAALPRPSNADAVLAFIRCQIARGEPFPSQRAIADFMGWKTDRGVPPVMMCLRAAGHVIVKERHPSGRGWRYEWELADQVPSASSPSPVGEGVDTNPPLRKERLIKYGTGKGPV